VCLRGVDGEALPLYLILIVSIIHHEMRSQMAKSSLVVEDCYHLLEGIISTKTKVRGFSPRANHTDRAAAAGRRS